MTLSINCKKETKKKSDGLTVSQIQKTPGIYKDITKTDDDNFSYIVNVLGTKESCFFCHEDGNIQAVAWNAWRHFRFELALNTEIKFSCLRD